MQFLVQAALLPTTIAAAGLGFATWESYVRRQTLAYKAHAVFSYVTSAEVVAAATAVLALRAAAKGLPAGAEA